jgi:hypothetical protein
LVFENHSFCALDCRSVDGKHLVDHARQGIERWLDSITPIDRHVTVEDLLEHFGACDQPLVVPDELFEQTLGVGFVGM